MVVMVRGGGTLVPVCCVDGTYYSVRYPHTAPSRPHDAASFSIPGRIKRRRLARNHTVVILIPNVPPVVFVFVAGDDRPRPISRSLRLIPHRSL